MKAFLDFEEKSVEKAVQKACAELNVSKEKLKYDIISYGSSGIFGLVGVKKALIRVSVSEDMHHKMRTDDTENKAESSSISGNADLSHRKAVRDLVNEAFGEVSETEDMSGTGVDLDPQADDLYTDTDVEDNGAAEPGDVAAGLHAAKEFLEKIIEILAVDVAVSEGQEQKYGHIFIQGKDSGFLIGKKGQTLEAIQYLADKVVNKQCGKGVQVFIDVEGYIESRKVELNELARRLAEKAQKTGKPSTISRMNAQERRIVHLALKNNKAVRTQSVGDGYYRKLIIFPKKKPAKKKSKEPPVSS
ncbi:MAG: Jag N-terminal domain-containing protein [Desulfobacterales bacterium]|jgi:spoIIIJ-associated protein|nr:Jag N-terminal domain-containing protein [Desulfobacterales bacterium]